MLTQACEEEVAARLVIHWEGIGGQDMEGKKAWEVKTGPFTDETFSSAPETHYSLLVQEVNKWVSELDELIGKFNFIPNWRVDDLMVSYAAEGGGVGPHLDNYDVFLLQGRGTRRWAISYSKIPPESEEWVEGLDLRILQGGFAKEEEWELEAGDILYVPPRVPHWGTALDDECMTFSVGFRAPNLQELTAEYAASISDAMEEEQFYEDPGLKAQAEDPGKIDEGAVTELWDGLKETLLGSNPEEGQERFKRFFGGYVTEGLRKSPVALDRTIDRAEAEAIIQDIGEGVETELQRAEGIKFAWLNLASSIGLFVHGKLYEVSDTKEGLKAVQTLCRERAFGKEELELLLSEEAKMGEVIVELIEEGCLYCPGHDEVEFEEDLSASS